MAAVREKFPAITDRFATFQAQCLNVHVEFPLPAASRAADHCRRRQVSRHQNPRHSYDPA